MTVVTHDTELPVLKPRKPRKIEYPEGDGKPMGETIEHRRAMNDCIDTVERYVRDRPDVYVSGNDFIYYEEGNPKARVSPDCWLVGGVDKRVRRTFKIWENGGHTPFAVFEFTSKSTRGEDLGRKFRLYEQAFKVAEYFLFDPLGEYLKPRLQGFRLREGRYEPIPLDETRTFVSLMRSSPSSFETWDENPVEIATLYSEQLGLEMGGIGQRLRFFDPKKGEWVPGNLEMAHLADVEAQRAEMEAHRANAEAHRADEEAQRADEEATARAEAERRAADAAAETARLRAELESLRRILSENA